MTPQNKAEEVAKEITEQKETGILDFILSYDILLMFAVIIVIGIIVLWFLNRRKKTVIGEIELSKLAQAKIIVYAGLAVVFLLFISGVVVHRVNGSDKFLVNLSITIIISWLVLLVSYYAWALYFYNIGLGWSDDKWKRFRLENEDPTAVPQARNKNPHDEETLGLPPGTVRGTIALTLLVGALALTIASFGMENALQTNAVLIDNFDFYKQAFLMMIAFYFGAKSLEILQGGSSSKPKAPDGKKEENNTVAKDVNLQNFQGDFNDPNAQG